MSTLIRFSAGRNKYDNTPKQLVVDDFDGLVEHMETNRGRKKGSYTYAVQWHLALTTIQSNTNVTHIISWPTILSHARSFRWT